MPSLQHAGVRQMMLGVAVSTVALDVGATIVVKAFPARDALGATTAAEPPGCPRANGAADSSQDAVQLVLAMRDDCQVVLDKQGSSSIEQKSGTPVRFDQGGELERLPCRLRIRRLGVRVPSGAQKIKAVTSRNVGYGLDSLP
jgi:hypothetical protein